MERGGGGVDLGRFDLETCGIRCIDLAIGNSLFANRDCLGYRGGEKMANQLPIIELAPDQLFSLDIEQTPRSHHHCATTNHITRPTRR